MLEIRCLCVSTTNLAISPCEGDGLRERLSSQAKLQSCQEYNLSPGIELFAWDPSQRFSSFRLASILK